MLHHECSQLTVQVAEKNDISFAHLIEYTYQVSFAIGSSLCGLHGRNIGNVAVITDGVVVDEIAHVFNEAIISDGYISQGGIVDAGMLYKALAYFYILVESADVYFTIEHHAMHKVGLEVLRYIHGGPVFCPTVITLEHLDFF